MIHKTDRNIVLAGAYRNALELSFGPSDDDFHYQAHHATVAHDDAAQRATVKPMDVKLIFQGGGCEMQWATGDNARDEYKWDGYVQISHDGKLSFPFWSVDEDGNQKVPFWAVFDDNGLRVYTYEGEPPSDQFDQWQVFDSNKVEA